VLSLIAYAMMSLKCISLNIRGIKKAIKRRNLFRWLHNDNGKYDIIFFYKKLIATKQSKMSRAQNGEEIFSTLMAQNIADV